MICNNCGGFGYINENERYVYDEYGYPIRKLIKCPKCNGTGKLE